MNSYFSTFIPGFGEVIRDQLSGDLENLSIDLLCDGLVVYKTSSPVWEIQKLRYFNNSFIKTDPSENIFFKPGNAFRVVFSRENELVAVNRERLSKIEKKIADLNGLVVDRANPDFEFWFLERSEGYKFTGVRITKHPDYKTVLAKGQLRPELADILCLLSNPQKSDIVLDPFAGSGAIGMARKNYPYTKIISEDINVGFDATDMTKIAGQSIDKIITDPPWGISVGKELNLPNFYLKTLEEFERVLKPGGLAIVLMGNKSVFEESLCKTKKLTLAKSYNILVSGKKATVYCFKS